MDEVKKNIERLLWLSPPVSGGAAAGSSLTMTPFLPVIALCRRQMQSLCGCKFLLDRKTVIVYNLGDT